MKVYVRIWISKYLSCIQILFLYFHFQSIHDNKLICQLLCGWWLFKFWGLRVFFSWGGCNLCHIFEDNLILHFCGSMFWNIMNGNVQHTYIFNPNRHGIFNLQLHMGGGYYSPGRLKSVLLPKYKPFDSQTLHTRLGYHLKIHRKKGCLALIKRTYR